MSAYCICEGVEYRAYDLQSSPLVDIRMLYATEVVSWERYLRLDLSDSFTCQGVRRA